MRDYNYCCSKDGHGLSFPSFSVVFIQTFSIHDNLEFVLPLNAVRKDYEKIKEEISENAEMTLIHKEIADHLDIPVVYMNQNIERQIFILDGKENQLERKILTGQRLYNAGFMSKLRLALRRKVKRLIQMYGRSLRSLCTGSRSVALILSCR